MADRRRVLERLRRLWRGAAHDMPPRETAPSRLSAPGAPDLPFASILKVEHDLPVPDWARVNAWMDRMADGTARGHAWAAAERGWLLHMRDALGSSYRLDADADVLLLSSLDPVVGRATLAFIRKTAQRVDRVLQGLTAGPQPGHDILLVFDDEDTYYRYVARYYPDGGEFAASGGMFIQDGCGHFVTRKDSLSAIEPVIAHEMTHAALSHLPLPLWLNEGLAVNTEQRLCGGENPHVSVQQGRRLPAYWTSERIQDFWSGVAFHQPGLGAELAYVLARVLVAELARDWPRFRDFALHARAADAGQAAARDHLSLDLGRAVAALLGRDDAGGFAPSMADCSAAEG